MGRIGASRERTGHSVLDRKHLDGNRCRVRRRTVRRLSPAVALRSRDCGRLALLGDHRSKSSCQVQRYPRVAIGSSPLQISGAYKRNYCPGGHWWAGQREHVIGWLDELGVLPTGVVRRCKHRVKDDVRAPTNEERVLVIAQVVCCKKHHPTPKGVARLVVFDGLVHEAVLVASNVKSRLYLQESAVKHSAAGFGERPSSVVPQCRGAAKVTVQTW